jgi:N-acetylglucosaminyldiphosphoundecaprenol N-acetyl-beta-D-mannosaminyltransferase
MRENERYDVLGVPVSITTLRRAADTIRDWASDGRGRFVCIRDVHGVMQAMDDPRLMALHRDAAMVTPDGMPLVWIGKRRGLAVERTCGPDLMEMLICDPAYHPLGHYFYGGKPDIAKALADKFTAIAPRLRVCGTETPPFTELSEVELAGLAERIAESRADVVWIGLSTPKQEYLMQRLAPRVAATLIGVGAAFDFHAGTVRRAPRWMQRSGLEWAFRLGNEPRRLWRRYLIMAPRFLIALAAHRRR